ncbi:hypothetical protein FS837_001098 [Tulasnella sp. UAMH 9824]|nr:hypothetical protein FS837_001098 [Tulasnella sp. UAMH 9824]
MSTVTIDGVEVNVTALNTSLALKSIGCHTRTLYATNMTNTNHTVTVAYGGSGLGATVLNKFMFDDGADTPRADPTATRLPVTIQDTGATATPTSGSTSESTDGGFECTTFCKGTSIGGSVIGVIIWLCLVLWCYKRCCRRKVVRKTVYVERQAEPDPQTVVVVAATLEVQQTHIHVEAADGGNSVATAPPAYAPRPGQAQEQTNFR